MTAAHKTAEYLRNSRIVRKQTNDRLKRGLQVVCGRCGGAIQPGQAYDVGHVVDASRGGSNALSNLHPEHRGENRSAGGRMGAAKTNGASRRARRLPTL